MSKTGKNVHRGSRSRYNSRREARRPDTLEGLPAGIRMKGGIRSNPTGDGYIAIVHVWDNIECRGEPEEWRSSEVFATEEEAMRYYKANIRPGLERMMAEMASERPGGKFIHRKLE